jgi:hypothetical protein
MEDTSDNYGPDSDSPPRNEQEYLAHRVKELERTHRRWKVWILAAVAAAFLFLLFTGGFVLLRTSVQVARERMAAEDARQASEAARQQAEAAKQKAEQTRQQFEAEKQKDKPR